MGPLDGFSDAAVHALLVLIDTRFPNFGIVDGLQHACSTRLTVCMSWPRLAVRQHVLALLAVIGVAVLLKVVFGQAHAADGCGRRGRAFCAYAFLGRLESHKLCRALAF